jgi:hypothetical protein
MAHPFAKLAILVLADFFSPLFNNATHEICPSEFEISRLMPSDAYGIGRTGLEPFYR